MSRIFLLSPARSNGLRAQLLMRPEANFELARGVQIGDANIGEVFAFCSGLYFRGKLAYANRFMRAPLGVPGIYVITPSRGLVPADTGINLTELKEFSSIAVDATEPLFTGPLQATASTLKFSAASEVVLLGSIATGKYLDVLLPIFAERLLFPLEFVGRGDMSRGALMLRCAASGEEMQYAAALQLPKRPSKRTSKASGGG